MITLGSYAHLGKPSPPPSAPPVDSTSWKEYTLHSYACEEKEARIYIESHKGRVLECEESGDWITIKYLAEKEL